MLGLAYVRNRAKDGKIDLLERVLREQDERIKDLTSARDAQSASRPERMDAFREERPEAVLAGTRR